MTELHHTGKVHNYYSRSSQEDIKFMSKQTMDYPTSITYGTHLQYIHLHTDLPKAESGIITLEDNKAYLLVEDIDLKGDRLVLGANTALLGITSEISNLTSTGLSSGTALITSTKTFNIQNLTIHDVDTLFDCQGATGNEVVDTLFFNAENIPVLGTINNYDNFIVIASAFINSCGLDFQGTFGTISFTNSIFTNFLNGITMAIPASTTITRRFKVRDSSFITTGTGTSLNVNPSATIPNEGYKLIECNFGGGTSTHLVGVQAIDNIADFFRNRGIDNSKEVGGFHINTPATTTISFNTWTKIAGTTNPSSENSKFSHSNNLLTYTGSITKNFTIIYTVSLSSSNNKEIEVGVSVNGADPELESISLQTTDSAGKIGYQGLSYFLVLHEGDTLELYTRNISDGSNITASRMNITAV